MGFFAVVLWAFVALGAVSFCAHLLSEYFRRREASKNRAKASKIDISAAARSKAEFVKAQQEAADEQAKIEKAKKLVAVQARIAELDARLPRGYKLGGPAEEASTDVHRRQDTPRQFHVPSTVTPATTYQSSLRHRFAASQSSRARDAHEVTNSLENRGSDDQPYMRSEARQQAKARHEESIRVQKAEEEAEAERLKLAAEEAAKKEEKRIEELRASLPAEPDQDDRTACDLALRLPTGVRARRRFPKDSSVRVLYQFAETLGFPISTHAVFTGMPRAPLENLDCTLEAANLGGRVSLHCEKR